MTRLLWIGGPLLLAAFFGVPLHLLSWPLFWFAALLLILGVFFGAKGLVERLLPIVAVLGLSTLLWMAVSAGVQGFVSETLGTAHPRLAVGTLLVLGFLLWLVYRVLIARAKTGHKGTTAKPPSLRERVALIDPKPYVPLFQATKGKEPPEEDELGLFRRVPRD